MKEVELRLVAELVKNSRRSDRELAKALGISQPTVSRMIKKLEREGVIREYTMIPDFSKLGYEIMGASFIKLSDAQVGVSDELRRSTAELERKSPYPNLMAVNGMGSGKDRMFITFYEDYSAYSKAMQVTRQLPNVNVDTLDSFLVDLKDRSNYRILSMSEISNHILRQAEKTGKSSGRNKPVAESKNAKRNL